LNSSPDEKNGKHPLIKFPYNKKHEVERKTQYEKLYSRTSEQVEEEKKLIVEYKRIEANLKKLQKDKKRSFKGSNTDINYNPMEKFKKRKLKKKEKDIDEDKDFDFEDEIPVDASFETEYAESEQTPIKQGRKEKSIGPFVRSSTVMSQLPLSTKAGKKVDDVLMEIGIGLHPMPTAGICKVFNQLRQDIVTLHDLQKAVAEKEYQVQLLREQKLQVLKGKKDVKIFSPSSFKKKRSHSSTKADKKAKKRKKEKKEKEREEEVEFEAFEQEIFNM